MSEFFSYKDIPIHCTDTGKGRVVVLLHGFLENLSMWKSLSDALDKRCRVICIDLLGHGRSGNTGYIHTMEEQADMILELLRSKRLKRYAVIGHSMGGYIALAMAEKRPESIKGLCLMNSTALADSPEKRLNRDRAVTAVKSNKNTFIRIAIPMLFSEKNRSVFPEQIADITESALQTGSQGVIAALEGMKIRKSRVQLLAKAQFPTLMIIGKEDPALEYESLVKQVETTGIASVEFPDGHMSHIENTTELIAAIRSFIKSIFFS